MNTGYLENKVAIVSGSSQGIGKAIAAELCSHGVKVVLNGRDEQKLATTEREFIAKGFTVTACCANIRFARNCRKLISHALQRFGRIDMIINNAAVSSRGAIEQSADINFKILLETNYLGSVYLSKYAIPHLKKTKGHIIFIKSVGGMRGMPYNSAYTASKMAQAALAQALRSELYDFDVHVGLVYVGFTENDPNKEILDVDGSWVPLPKRNNVKLAQPMSVARSIRRMLEKRRSQMTLTGLGYFTYFMTHYFPFLSDRLVIWNRRLIRDQFTFISHEEITRQTSKGFKSVETSLHDR